MERCAISYLICLAVPNGMGGHMVHVALPKMLTDWLTGARPGSYPESSGEAIQNLEWHSAPAEAVANRGVALEWLIANCTDVLGMPYDETPMGTGSLEFELSHGWCITDGAIVRGHHLLCFLRITLMYDARSQEGFTLLRRLARMTPVKPNVSARLFASSMAQLPCAQPAEGAATGALLRVMYDSPTPMEAINVLPAGPHSMESRGRGGGDGLGHYPRQEVKLRNEHSHQLQNDLPKVQGTTQSWIHDVAMYFVVGVKNPAITFLSKVDQPIDTLYSALRDALRQQGSKLTDVNVTAVGRLSQAWLDTEVTRMSEAYAGALRHCERPGESVTPEEAMVYHDMFYDVALLVVRALHGQSEAQLLTAFCKPVVQFEPLQFTDGDLNTLCEFNQKVQAVIMTLGAKRFEWCSQREFASVPARLEEVLKYETWREVLALANKYVEISPDETGHLDFQGVQLRPSGGRLHTRRLRSIANGNDLRLLIEAGHFGDLMDAIDHRVSTDPQLGKHASKTLVLSGGGPLRRTSDVAAGTDESTADAAHAISDGARLLAMSAMPNRDGSGHGAPLGDNPPPSYGQEFRDAVGLLRDELRGSSERMEQSLKATVRGFDEKFAAVEGSVGVMGRRMDTFMAQSRSDDAASHAGLMKTFRTLEAGLPYNHADNRNLSQHAVQAQVEPEYYENVDEPQGLLRPGRAHWDHALLAPVETRQSSSGQHVATPAAARQPSSVTPPTVPQSGAPAPSPGYPLALRAPSFGGGAARGPPGGGADGQAPRAPPRNFRNDSQVWPPPGSTHPAHVGGGPALLSGARGATIKGPGGKALEYSGYEFNPFDELSDQYKKDIGNPTKEEYDGDIKHRVPCVYEGGWHRTGQCPGGYACRTQCAQKLGEARQAALKQRQEMRRQQYLDRQQTARTLYFAELPALEALASDQEQLPDGSMAPSRLADGLCSLCMVSEDTPLDAGLTEWDRAMEIHGLGAPPGLLPEGDARA